MENGMKEVIEFYDVFEEAREDWTVGRNGLANSSDRFEEIVGAVAAIVGNARLEENPRDVAGLIVAQLAHVHGLSPSEH